MKKTSMTSILYVTGDEPYASSVTAGLQKQPAYTVHTVSTVAQARQYLAEHPDLACLLCTDKLPESDVIDFIESLRQEYPDLPIVLYPADGSEELAVAALSAKTSGYLPHSNASDHIAELAKTIRDTIDSNWSLLTLRERLKELRGVRTVTQLLEDPVSRPLEGILRELVEEVPEAFQYPSIAEVRVTVDSIVVETDGFSDTQPMVRAKATTANGRNITLQVCYREDKPERDIGPFLSEEQAFCMTVVTLLKGGVERRTYVEELTKSETLFQELAENLTEVLWISDPESEEMLYVNPEYENVWGRSRASLYADPLSFLDAVHPDDRSRVETALKQKMTGRYEAEYRIIQPDGTVRWVYDRGIPVFDEGGDLYRFVGIAEDVTKRKARSQQLAVLHRILRHNLRNDLTVITGFAELIETAADGDLSEYAERILSTSTRLLELVEKQRQIAAEIESISSSKTVSVSEVTRRVRQEVLEEYPGAEIVIALDLSDEIRLPSQLELALFELLTNAIEHSDVEPPAATVRVQTTDDELRIRVIDTGPGIPRMDIDVLGREEEPLFHSRGLGLWIAYWTVTHVGGSLEFDDNEPRGTIVTVRLPREGEESQGFQE